MFGNRKERRRFRIRIRGPCLIWESDCLLSLMNRSRVTMAVWANVVESVEETVYEWDDYGGFVA